MSAIEIDPVVEIYAKPINELTELEQVIRNFPGNTILAARELMSLRNKLEITALENATLKQRVAELEQENQQLKERLNNDTNN